MPGIGLEIREISRILRNQTNGRLQSIKNHWRACLTGQGAPDPVSFATIKLMIMPALQHDTVGTVTPDHH